jgi:hypothetical protein
MGSCWSPKPAQALAERKATKIEVPEPRRQGVDGLADERPNIASSEFVKVSLEQELGLEKKPVLRLSEEVAWSEVQCVSSHFACPQSVALFAPHLMPEQNFFSPAMDSPCMFAPPSPMLYEDQGMGLDECDADSLPGLLIGLRGQVTNTEVPLAALALGCSEQDWEAATSCQRAYLD